MSDNAPDHRLRSIRIEGFKSIREAEVELGPLNVLIGENGSGKSNFVEAFRLVHAIGGDVLAAYSDRYGASNLFHLGLEATSQVNVQCEFHRGRFEINLGVDYRNVLKTVGLSGWGALPLGYPSPPVLQPSDPDFRSPVTVQLMAFVQQVASSWVVYHFHDTSPNSKSRGFAPLHHWDRLYPEGENLAAYLYRLKNGDPEDRRAFDRIERLVGLGLPFFDRFVLDPTPGRAPGNEDVLLRWRQKRSDFPFTAQHLSDGSLRYILLTTALNQPVGHRPTTMVIDEPELGLHPSMLALLAGQIKSVAATGQVIVATQSPALLDEFKPEDIVVVERHGAESTFRRLPLDQLNVWLEEYSLSDVVRKNLIGGLR